MTIITFSKNIQESSVLFADTNTNMVTFTIPSEGRLTMPWVQISSTIYGVNMNGLYSTSWKIFQFRDATNVTIYNIPLDKIATSPTAPTEQSILSVLPTINGTSGTYTGMLPIFQIDQTRKEITTKMEDLFKMQGTYAQSIESNYQSTMTMSIFVAMLGTTVMFYAFRQL